MIAEALSIEKIFTIIKARYDEDLVFFQVHFLKIWPDKYQTIAW